MSSFLSSLLHTECGHCAVEDIHATHECWLLQLSRALPRIHRTVEGQTELNKWITAAALLPAVVKVKTAAQEKVQQLGHTLSTSRQLHDALLACTIFGFLPPLRLACIRSLLHPSYKGPCPHPDCSREGCRGNRLVIISREPVVLSLKIPHHKNEKAWGQRPIEFNLPQAYAELMLDFVVQGHKVWIHCLLTQLQHKLYCA